MGSLMEDIDAVERFKDGSLRRRIAEIEHMLKDAGAADCAALCSAKDISPALLSSGMAVKRAAAQIDVILHAVGILVTLPHIMREDEIIESLSLGAGNTGREFDMETNLRVAEFKFINWKGGPEAIRQNSLFKDFYLLAEADTQKERHLYVIDSSRPLRFLNGRRAIRSVLSHENKLWREFEQRYGDRFSVVCEYYQDRRGLVRVEDLSKLLPDLWARPGESY